MKTILVLTFLREDDMPGSVKHGKQEIKDWLAKQKDIHTIVDIGAGSGTYPKLLGKKYKYIAIEIFEFYLKKWNLNKYYEDIIIGDVRKIDLPKGDCIIFGDVLEHMTKKEAKKVLFKVRAIYKHIIISIPTNDQWGTKPHYGNKHELHQSKWTFDEVKALLEWDYTKEIKGIGVFCL